MHTISICYFTLRLMADPKDFAELPQFEEPKKTNHLKILKEPVSSGLNIPKKPPTAANAPHPYDDKSGDNQDTTDAD